jgi:hypothetical protein
LLEVLSRCGGRVRGVGFEALLRRRVWCPAASVAGREGSVPSWAFFLFEVLLRTTGASVLPPFRERCPKASFASSEFAPGF